MFQEQMLDDELGLNWYAFKWRNYDPSLARFHNIDPLAEDYSYQSVYNFSENRVIDARELEGLEAAMAKAQYENEVSARASAAKETEKPKAKDKSSFLKGWNRTVSNFNNNFWGSVNRFGSDPVREGGKHLNNFADGTMQLLADVTMLSDATGRENKTASAMVDAFKKVADLPNMSNEEAGALTAGIFLTVLEVGATRKAPSSTFVKLAKRKGSIKNFETNVSFEDFGKNLEAGGFTKSLSKDGKVTIYTNGKTSYTLRAGSKSGPATAEFHNGKKIKHKIRLGVNAEE